MSNNIKGPKLATSEKQKLGTPGGTLNPYVTTYPVPSVGIAMEGPGWGPGEEMNSTSSMPSAKSSCSNRAQYCLELNGRL